MLSLVESLHRPTNVLPYILCIGVYFQPVIKLLQKCVRVYHRRVILMQKMQKFSRALSGGGRHSLPTTHPLGAFGARPRRSGVHNVYTVNLSDTDIIIYFSILLHGYVKIV